MRTVASPVSVRRSAASRLPAASGNAPTVENGSASAEGQSSFVDLGGGGVVKGDARIGHRAVEESVEGRADGAEENGFRTECDRRSPR